jgi:hypothetical protein
MITEFRFVPFYWDRFGHFRRCIRSRRNLRAALEAAAFQRTAASGSFDSGLDPHCGAP